MAKDDVLKLSTHTIGLACYNGVTNAKLKYGGQVERICFTWTGPEKLPKDVNKVPGILSGSFKTFASPMEMTWRARDGSELSHTVDLNKEIPDPRVSYEFPERVFAQKPFLGDPVVIVEFDDRTINIYFAATLLVRPLDPASREPDHADTYTLVYSRTL